MLPKLHLAKDTFTLHLLLESAEGLIDIVVTNHNLHLRHHLSRVFEFRKSQERAIYQPTPDLSTIGNATMADAQNTKSAPSTDPKSRLLEAALPHVAFDGWSDATFKAAIADSGIEAETARAIAPRRGLDLAVLFHKAGDDEMIAAMAEQDLTALRYRDRVIACVRKRIEIAGVDREAVRRGVTLFALPFNAPDGAKLVWGTADAIWTVLGDTSDDYNWYSKRTILSGVYSSTVLFWLGDDSEGAERTWEFLDRRIEGVMQFEKVKAQVRENKLAQFALWGPKQALSLIKPPSATRTGTPVGLPGRRN